jgi:glycosyltransferase involved in cell wall biosynthesis
VSATSEQPAPDAQPVVLIDVVFPCLNELQALPWVLSRLPPGYRAIVADNGSTDGSAELARSLGALVVDVPQRGFGAAVAAGIEAATTDILCICDADASLDPQQLPLVTGPLLAGEADLVMGSRQPVTWRAWPIHARLANRVLAGKLRRSIGAGAPALTDLGPMRAARRVPLLDLGIVDRRFGYPLEMVLLAAAAGWRISEVPVDYLPRSGRSKVTGTVRGTMRAIHDMRAVLARGANTPRERETDRGGEGTTAGPS